MIRVGSQRQGWLVEGIGCALVLLTTSSLALAYRFWRENKQQQSSEEQDEAFVMNRIGTVRSPFPQRAGCPRQGGMLAPHVCSHVVLDVPMEAIDGLETYSHVWIVFAFHLNPRGKAKQQRSNTKGFFAATKIKPPRAGGRKVGVLATRAPHRPNPIGLSLAFLESIQTTTTTTTTTKRRKRPCLVLKGLDLVDGTPVYDIKPYVPWDQVGYQPRVNVDDRVKMGQLVVPSWVSASDDVLARVDWNDASLESLETHLLKALAPWYKSMEDAKRAITEIVVQDPRALQDGRGRDSCFAFSFGLLRVEFTAKNGVATISSVAMDEGDLDATPGSYPHNLALRRRAERASPEY